MANWVTVTDHTARVPAVDCGALEVSFTLAPDAQYLTTAATSATVDYASDTGAIGVSQTLTVTVQHANYKTNTDPAGTYAHTFATGDPCNDADALTLGTAYIDGLAATYDLFSDFDAITWDPAQVVTAANAAITDSNCGALSVTLAYTSGP